MGLNPLGVGPPPGGGVGQKFILLKLLKITSYAMLLAAVKLLEQAYGWGQPLGGRALNPLGVGWVKKLCYSEVILSDPEGWC